MSEDRTIYECSNGQCVVVVGTDNDALSLRTTKYWTADEATLPRSEVAKLSSVLLEWLGVEVEPFTCPNCGGHEFGTFMPDDRSKWTVACHRGWCDFAGPYAEHVNDLQVEPE